MNANTWESHLQNLTLGSSLRLEDLVDRDALSELVRSFFALFGIGLRVYGGESTLLAESATPQPLCAYLDTLPGGRRACSTTVVAAKRLAVLRESDGTHPCFTGAEYRIIGIWYESRALGKIILGPFLRVEVPFAPASLLSVDTSIDAPSAHLLWPQFPRAKSATIDLLAEHLRRTLDLLLFSGHKALLASEMHLATVRQSYRELEEKNRQLERALERTQELDRLKSNFLGTVSHELKTPLTSILGYGEMLSEGVAGPLSTSQSEFVAVMQQKGTELLELICSLLDLSKMESGTIALHRVRCRAEPLVAQAVATFTPVARKRRVNIAVQCGLDTLWGDPDRIRQVLINLLDNALKFSPPGGTIYLQVLRGEGAMETADPDDLFAALPRAKCVELCVADEGPGIPLAEREKIFDPFYQVDSSSTREHQGTGLGLSVVRRLVSAHGGTVHVEENQPRGTRFVVQLPDPAIEK